MNSLEKTRNMVMTAVFTAIIIIMAFVPFLGYIPLGFMNATIIHIPVIVGAILLGPKSGAFLGLVFGLTSMWKSTTAPIVTSFVFSPFTNVSINGVSFVNIVGSTIIPLVPRILIGVAAYYVYEALMKIWSHKKQHLALIGAGVAGSLTNTLLVMNFIYLFFGGRYAEASGKAFKGLYMVILGVICMNGIPEALLAGILTMAIARALFKVKQS
ncbi:MAG: ECF transporter S component [Clostridiaceae bacterium]|nr:ECF transporter S component [Clostridiaceae bacterium]